MHYRGAGYLKTSGGVLRQRVAVKYAFMQTHHHKFRLARMCRVLGVSRSGFYAWHRRRPSTRLLANQQLVEQMRRLHQETREA